MASQAVNTLPGSSCCKPSILPHQAHASQPAAARPAPVGTLLGWRQRLLPACATCTRRSTLKVTPQACSGGMGATLPLSADCRAQVALSSES